MSVTDTFIYYRGISDTFWTVLFIVFSEYILNRTLSTAFASTGTYLTTPDDFASLFRPLIEAMTSCQRYTDLDLNCSTLLLGEELSVIALNP